MNQKVYFEIFDECFVREWCEKNGIGFPEEKISKNGLDFHVSTFQTWSYLYSGCPYVVMGCYFL